MTAYVETILGRRSTPNFMQAWPKIQHPKCVLQRFHQLSHGNHLEIVFFDMHLSHMSAEPPPHSRTCCGRQLRSSFLYCAALRLTRTEVTQPSATASNSFCWEEVEGRLRKHAVRREPAIQCFRLDLHNLLVFNLIDLGKIESFMATTGCSDLLKLSGYHRRHPEC